MTLDNKSKMTCEQEDGQGCEQCRGRVWARMSGRRGPSPPAGGRCEMGVMYWKMDVDGSWEDDEMVLVQKAKPAQLKPKAGVARPKPKPKGRPNKGQAKLEAQPPKVRSLVTLEGERPAKGKAKGDARRGGQAASQLQLLWLNRAAGLGRQMATLSNSAPGELSRALEQRLAS